MIRVMYGSRNWTKNKATGYGAGLVAVTLLLGTTAPGLSAEAIDPLSPASPTQCSAAPNPLADAAQLTDALLLALPGYLNRALQRLGDTSGSLRTNPPPLTYVLVAGNAQIEPLSNPQPGGAPLVQIFFTTLERQYINAQLQPLQQFHQLVLAQVPEPESWRLIRLRSQFAPYPANQQRLSPPRNSDDGPTAQAIRRWLQDRAARDTLSLSSPICKDFEKINRPS